MGHWFVYPACVWWSDSVRFWIICIMMQPVKNDSGLSQALTTAMRKWVARRIEYFEFGQIIFGLSSYFSCHTLWKKIDNRMCARVYFFCSSWEVPNNTLVVNALVHVSALLFSLGHNLVLRHNAQINFWAFRDMARRGEWQFDHPLPCVMS